MVSTQKQTIIEDLRSLPLGTDVIGFLDYLVVEAGLSHNTILAYGRDLRQFLDFIAREVHPAFSLACASGE